MGYSLAQEKDKYLVFLEFSLLCLLPHLFPPVKSGIRGERTGEKFILIQLALFKKCSLGSERDYSSLGASVILWRQPWGMAALYRLMTQAIPPPQHLPAEGTPTLGPGRGPWLLPSQGVDKGGSCCSHLTCEMWLCQPASHLQTHPGESQAPFSASKHGAWTQVGLFTCFLNAAFEKGRF